MSIYGVLRHRCTIRRAGKITLNGSPINSWETIESDVPCLLDAYAGQSEPTYSSGERTDFNDRSGRLLAAPGVDVRPGDRLVMTRGASGTFTVSPDPAVISTLSGPHHAEFKVEQVPG
jgi:hypothetical protein